MVNKLLRSRCPDIRPGAPAQVRVSRNPELTVQVQPNCRLHLDARPELPENYGKPKCESFCWVRSV
jgi:hypothetical protein